MVTDKMCILWQKQAALIGSEYLYAVWSEYSGCELSK